MAQLQPFVERLGEWCGTRLEGKQLETFHVLALDQDAPGWQQLTGQAF
jgi:hypothetical protein